jgi:hypothetical protein
MRALHIERLEKLVWLLRNLKTEFPAEVMKFDMTYWGHTKESSCGSSACALGFAGSHPWFIRRGLKLVHDIRYCLKLSDLWIIYKEVEGFQAAVEFFGIPGDTAYRFFTSSSYRKSHERITPSDVARRIEAFVNIERKKGVTK